MTEARRDIEWHETNQNKMLNVIQANAAFHLFPVDRLCVRWFLIMKRIQYLMHTHTLLVIHFEHCIFGNKLANCIAY